MSSFRDKGPGKPPTPCTPNDHHQEGCKGGLDIFNFLLYISNCRRVHRSVSGLPLEVSKGGHMYPLLSIFSDLIRVHPPKHRTLEPKIQCHVFLTLKRFISVIIEKMPPILSWLDAHEASR